MHSTSFFHVRPTPFPNDFGSLPALRHVPSGLSSTQTSSYHTFVPPSHGRFSGKFAPPATTSASSLTPANIAANPSLSGSGGNGDHAGVWDMTEEEKIKLQIPRIKEPTRFKFQFALRPT